VADTGVTVSGSGQVRGVMVLTCFDLGEGEVRLANVAVNASSTGSLPGDSVALYSDGSSFVQVDSSRLTSSIVNAQGLWATAIWNGSGCSARLPVEAVSSELDGQLTQFEPGAFCLVGDYMDSPTVSLLYDHQDCVFIPPGG
jgi:hypothetical protein